REAREVAEEIGALLRATGRVRRGIGTIREDLNVSIEGGARAEIKGVQELRLIQRYVEGEEERQRTLLAARDRLLAQGARVPDAAPLDVSEMLRAVATGPISQTLKKGGVVFGTALPGFAGSLRPDPEAPERLGRELADYARATGVRGLLHSDELPAQGVEGPVVEEIRRKLHADGPSDAFVLLAAPDPGAALRGIEAVRNRARAALEGVPRETRDPLPDGRSRYSRPLPGRDRMYPETDVPPLAILSDRLARLGAVLPEAPDRVRARLVATYAISPDVARQIQRWGETGRFEALIGRGRAVASVARLLTQELSALESSEGPEAVERISLDTLDALLLAVEGGEFSKEGIPTVLVELSKGAPSLREAAGRAGLSGISAETLAQLADAVVERNLAMVEDRGEAAFRPLMGDLMREVRGRRDGQEVAEALRAALARHRRKAPE
ncbi:MAG TPA: Glu-tRNA(Gln) amidotransferase GatDE subunit E, partial [Thermoplasmata archaeon]|nr:Glu-tRNA(Gln) amidotransferase GatDE subunit E [Thermoplasmata archaeon]